MRRDTAKKGKRDRNLRPFARLANKFVEQEERETGAPTDEEWKLMQKAKAFIGMTDTHDALFSVLTLLST